MHAVLRERGVESYLPLAPREREWKDRRKVVDFPLFPSYVFGRFALSSVHRVLSVPGVATLVRANGRPVAIADEELENVRRFARALAAGEVHAEERPYFAEGEWVEVTEGPLTGLRGVVVEQRGRRRFLVGLKEIGQGFEVNVDVTALRIIATP